MLKKYIAVYIPGTTNVNQPLTKKSQHAIAVNTAREFAREFGGNTITPAEGLYIDSNGNTVIERILIVKSYHDKDSAAAASFARKIAAGLKVQLTQESVTIESNAGIDFI